MNLDINYIEGDYYFEATITYEILINKDQRLKKEHYPDTDFRTVDPDDNSDWYSKSWVKDGTVSFAEKEWDKFVKRIHEHFNNESIKKSGVLVSTEDDGNKKHLYWFQNHYLIKEKVLHRASIYITRRAVINYDDNIYKEIQSYINEKMLNKVV